MAIAKAAGFNVPPFTLLNIEKIGHVFAIKRFDRTADDVPLMMEDMGQVIGVPSADKYQASYEKVVAALNDYSSAPRVDVSDFFHRLIFCYLTANGDMHLKNWTLVENEKALGTFLLSPCYDLLNTRLPIPGEKSDIGLTMLGKDRNLQASYFKKFAEQMEIPNNIVEGAFKKLPKWYEISKDFAGKSLLKEASKKKYLELLSERFQVLRS
jgi:serine/threonine-protein kinase HipA